MTRSTSTSTNRYAYLVDVAGDAGINGVSTDPFTWGVPSLSFSSYSGLRDMTPTNGRIGASRRAMRGRARAART